MMVQVIYYIWGKYMRGYDQQVGAMFRYVGLEARVPQDHPLRLIRAVVVVFALCTGAAFANKSDDASQFVEKLSIDIIAFLAEDDLSHGAGNQRLRKLLIANVDVKTVGRAALGPYWMKATDDQRALYRSIYPDYMLATYRGLFRHYATEALEVTGSQPINERESLVKGELKRPKSPPIKMVFRVRKTGDAFKLLDVLVEGISLLSKQQSEFATVIQHEGMDGFLKRLQEIAHRPVADL